MRKLKPGVRRTINRARRLLSQILGIAAFSFLFFTDRLPEYDTYLSGDSEYSIDELVAVSAEKRRLFLSSELTDRIPVFAHRGYSENILEETFEAFDAAMAVGVPQVELDVWSSSDGVLYVSHDKTLEKVAGSSLSIPDTSSEVLSQTHVYNGETVHTLAELFDRYGDNMLYLVELKDAARDTGLFIDLMADYEDLQHNVLVQTWNLNYLRTIDEAYPGMFKQLLLNVANYDQYEQALTSDWLNSIAMDSRLVDEEVVEEVHSYGKEIWVWTVNDEEAMEKYYAMGVDGIITDKPDTALAAYASVLESELLHDV